MKRKIKELIGDHNGRIMMPIKFDDRQIFVPIKSISMGDNVLDWEMSHLYKITLENGIIINHNSENIEIFNTVKFPAKRVHETPRLLLADAYTIGSGELVSKKCTEKSTYYVTFRKPLHLINPDIYDIDDDRIVFVGLQRIIERLFSTPITHEEIDKTLEYLKKFRVSSNGLESFSFDEKMWRKVVDEFNGFPPIEIKAMPEGSVVYPNEPVIQIENKVGGFGECGAWFESKILQVWATSERCTQNQHFFKKIKNLIKDVYKGSITDEQVSFYASIMLQDFGDRAGMNMMESEDLGLTHLYTFPGTDTVAGGYQAYRNGASVGSSISVKALAHRVVQGYEDEFDAYQNMYDKEPDGSYLSMVSDCYDFYNATEKFLLPLAKRSIEKNNGKVIVARPDSGDAEEQVLWICRLAKFHKLYKEVKIGKKTYYESTTLKFIEGDGMDFHTILKICTKLLEFGFLPWSWGLFGVGGGLRNFLKRDDFSAKYALNAMGMDDESVVKFSEDIGKTTLPGPFKILRDNKSLEERKTIVFESEEGANSMITYFDGTSESPFKEGMIDDFNTIKRRIHNFFDYMPFTLKTEENNNYPISDKIRSKRFELLKKHAPKKRMENY